MQREKLYNFVNTVCCDCFQNGEILSSLFSYGQNLVAQDFLYFENKKGKYREKDSYASCSAFHAALDNEKQFLSKFCYIDCRWNRSNSIGR